MSREVEIKITSEIHQEDDAAVFERDGLGSIERIGDDWRIKYDEKNKEGDVEVKLLVKPHELVMQRGDIKGDHTLMKFEPGEKRKCKIMAAGKQMNLESLTNKLDFSEISPGKMQLKVEYDLFSGLYLVGNYAIKIDIIE
ncbi:DUF1934 domain-containing protein [Lactobacillus paragasseri]|uniref:DUF1934 domain-containing protein n=1 Tax=Lactobacillus paragasseri TaxID=2107999 RepID=UPI00217E7EB9|nr:DUF1934 domain-containing protein [Lactobacillus paragasseri]UWI42949.1 DUF1934 domain-containing protein [Lactobacillus paragasseri]UWI45863.1 DUF1934 domain-containing protein [Lactobacillus paragasseri]